MNQFNTTAQQEQQTPRAQRALQVQQAWQAPQASQALQARQDSHALQAQQAPQARRLFSLCATIVLACMLAAGLLLTGAPRTALAAQTQSGYVLDEYGLFDSSQRSSLESQAKATSSTYGVGVYLLIVDDVGTQSARSYAIDYYNSHNLGLGDQNSGILFLIAVDSRDYVTVTYGDGINAFTDWQIGEMEDKIVDELKSDEWYAACDVYLNQAEYALQFRSENGAPLDSDNAPASPLMIFIVFAMAFAIAAAAASGWSYYLYRQMKTAVEASNAKDYIDKGSFKLTAQKDWYVTSTVVATPKPKSNPSSKGSSIGSGGFGGSSGGKF